MLRVAAGITIGVVLSFSLVAWAGTLNPPGDPDALASAMYTLQAIYDRLTTGAEGSKRGSGFVEPSSGPAGTGVTLNDVMAAAPLADDASGAKPEDVRIGTSFWSLRTGTWGLQAGTRHPAPVWKTGAQIVHHPGDDGDLRMGVPWPDPRFTINDDATVTDNLTGLIWLQHANCMVTDANLGFDQGGADPDDDPNDGFVTWYRAFEFIERINTLSDNVYRCGSDKRDWRLPNIRELGSLFNYRHGFTWTEGDPFYQADLGHWVSTTVPGGWGRSWGRSGYQYKNTAAGGVWPVRGGYQ